MREKNVMIAVLNETGNESEVLRQALEYFGFITVVKYIGRPNDFISLLADKSDDFRYKYLIICSHGDNGNFVMPQLSPEIYSEGEPRGNFTPEIISKIIRLENKTVISSGCTTGNEKTASVFSENNLYIAPAGYIDGKSAVFFIVRFFYMLAQKGCSPEKAFSTARNTDSETKLFVLRGFGSV